MTDAGSKSSLDKLVLAALKQDSSDVDAAALLRGIEERLAHDQSGNEGPARMRMPSSRRFAGWFSGLAAAACLAVGVWYVLVHNPKESFARSLLEAVYETLTPNDDRCYDVHLTMPQEAAETFPFIAAHGATRLWTSGRQFCVRNELDGHIWWWGRNASDRIWLAPSPELGLAFAAEELPPTVRVAARVMEMRLDTLVKNMMVDYELTAESAGETGEERVRATLERSLPNKRLVEVELVVNSDTNLIRSAKLTWGHRGHRVGPAEFVLLGGEHVEPTWYEPSEHLKPQATILDGHEAEARLEAYREFMQRLKRYQSG